MEETNALAGYLIADIQRPIIAWRAGSSGGGERRLNYTSASQVTLPSVYDISVVGESEYLIKKREKRKGEEGDARAAVDALIGVPSSILGTTREASISREGQLEAAGAQARGDLCG